MEIDGGYFANLTLVLPVNPMFTYLDGAKAKAAEFLNHVIEQFKLSLRELAPRNLSRPSIAKDDFGNLASTNVFCVDQGFRVDVGPTVFKRC